MIVWSKIKNHKHVQENPWTAATDVLMLMVYCWGAGRATGDSGRRSPWCTWHVGNGTSPGPLQTPKFSPKTANVRLPATHGLGSNLKMTYRRTFCPFRLTSSPGGTAQSYQALGGGGERTVSCGHRVEPHWAGRHHTRNTGSGLKFWIEWNYYFFSGGSTPNRGLEVTALRWRVPRPSDWANQVALQGIKLVWTLKQLIIVDKWRKLIEMTLKYRERAFTEQVWKQCSEKKKYHIPIQLIKFFNLTSCSTPFSGLCWMNGWMDEGRNLGPVTNCRVKCMLFYS